MKIWQWCAAGLTLATLVAALPRSRSSARLPLLLAFAALLPAIWLAADVSLVTSGLLLAAAVAAAWLAVAGHHAAQVTRAETDHLRHLAQERSERVAVLFHEVRTPLSLIKGSAELLSDGYPGPLTEKQREFVDTITTNCERTIALAEDLLAQARAEAQLFDVHLKAMDLRGLARRVVRELRGLHPNPILLDAHGAPLLVVGDPVLLRQVLTNLVNNAARHGGPDGRITVRITFGEDEALVAITDEGVGMTSDAAARLFEKYSAGATTGGTGLGMPIARAIVELHDGRIYADTIPGRGTTIFFTIPRAR